MPYTLYGSQTSPYVRRLKILLEDIAYDFKEIAVFEKEGAAILNKINPLNKVPVLTDGDLTIWDSRQIFSYLNAIHRFQNMTWEDENLLTAIEGAMESGIALLLLKRSGFDIFDDKMFFKRQFERIESILKYLEEFMKGAGLTEWNFHSISLYSFLDWASHRGLVKTGGRPILTNFLKAHATRAIVFSTKIPEGM